MVWSVGHAKQTVKLCINEFNWSNDSKKADDNMNGRQDILDTIEPVLNDYI